MYSDFQACQKALDGVLAIDFYLAYELTQSVCRSQNISEPDQLLLFHSIIACSEALRDGHTCLKLSQLSEKLHWQNNEENKPGYLFPQLSSWQESLAGLRISPADKHPLVYELQRIYLRRYWQFEIELTTTIRSLLDSHFSVDVQKGHDVLKKLFDEDNSAVDWQKVSVANALNKQFTIIAGGPGTGKTFTVTKLLVALQVLSSRTLRITLVAPTGKAAQRLNESIQKAKSYLYQQKSIDFEIINTIPDTASTLHRLLGVKPDSHNFRYNENRTLPFDVILVDEISMIDLPLMTRLMRAIHADCRVIMLGDADQLPSVAAGSVLSDLAPYKEPGYSFSNGQLLKSLCGMDVPITESAYDHLTVLQKSHRFDGGGEIGKLAKQVISGHAEQSWHYLENGQQQISRAGNESFYSWLERFINEYYTPLFKTDSNTLMVTEAFKRLNQFRFLAATRLGEQGVKAINDYIEQYLRYSGLIDSQNEFYHGRPIMVTENHYHVGLYNGDIGLIWMNEQGHLQAAFPQTKQQNDSDSTIKWLSLGRLPTIETVYAMTIHKTQGSEFEQVALVLPQQDSPILSRELLYTGITRASNQLSIWSEQSIWELAVKRKVQRYSGLQERVFETL